MSQQSILKISLTVSIMTSVLVCMAFLIFVEVTNGYFESIVKEDEAGESMGTEEGSVTRSTRDRNAARYNSLFN